MSGFISTAFAQVPTAASAAAPAAAAVNPSNNVVNIIMLVAFLGIFYFLMIRPQSQRAKKQRQFLAALVVGEEVITSGGILGKIVHLTDQFCTIEIADNVNITVQRSSLVNSVPKGTMKTI